MTKHITQINHNLSGNCFCSSFSNLFKLHGYKYDDSVIYGLSCCIYLGFVGMIDKRTYNIVVNYPNMLFSLASNTGIKYRTINSKNPSDELNYILDFYKHNHIIVLQLHPSLCIPNRDDTVGFVAYAPAHWITVVGYDISNEIFYYYDNRSFNMKQISFDKFFEGRDKGIEDTNPRRTLYLFDFCSELYSLETSIKLSLNSTINLNLYQAKVLSMYSSESGLNKFLRVIDAWTKFLSLEQVQENLLRMKISITGGYSVKGGYRMMFVRYLEFLSSCLNDNRIAYISDIYRESASLWDKLLLLIDDALLRQRDLDRDFFDVFKYLLSEIFTLEQKGFSELNIWNIAFCNKSN
jgi:hypothetical protein